MELSNARQIIVAHMDRTLVVRFTKRDGTPRRIVCRYYGNRSLRPEMMTVWDVEKGALRSINLNAVYSIKCGGEELFATREWTDVDPADLCQLAF